MAPITARDMIQALRRLVAETGPDHVYQRPFPGLASCKYEYEGQPSCGIGRVLAAAGVPINVLSYLDNAGSIASIEALVILRSHGFPLQGNAAKIAEAFQMKQDALTPYGLSLAAAEERYQQS